MIGKRQLQAGDPPPDLAIETDVTCHRSGLGYWEFGRVGRSGRSVAKPDVMSNQPELDDLFVSVLQLRAKRLAPSIDRKVSY